MAEYTHYISVRCNTCGHIEHIECTDKQLQRYKNGEHAQNVFPNLDPGVRELLISGECGVCFSLDCLNFPQEALNDISKRASELLNKDIHLSSKSALRHMLKDLEHSDDTSVEDYHGAVKKIRDEIEEIADMIDEGVYDSLEDMEYEPRIQKDIFDL